MIGALRLKAEAEGFGFGGLGLQGLGFRVEGSGFRAWGCLWNSGLGFGAWGFYEDPMSVVQNLGEFVNEFRVSTQAFAGGSSGGWVFWRLTRVLVKRCYAV